MGFAPGRRGIRPRISTASARGSSKCFNDSAIRTVICAVITANLQLAKAPGNVQLGRRASGLNKESVVNVSQLVTLDKRFLTERVAGLAPASLRNVDAGLRLALAL